MGKLTNELKKEHQQIGELLAQVNAMGIGSEKGQKKFMDAKLLLLSHLKKEDLELYPTLKKEALKNPSLEKDLHVFSLEMEAITNVAIQFFAKYEKGGSGFEFGKDFGKVNLALTQRIHKEETALYAEYDRIMGSH